MINVVKMLSVSFLLQLGALAVAHAENSVVLQELTAGFPISASTALNALDQNEGIEGVKEQLKKLQSEYSQNLVAAASAQIQGEKTVFTILLLEKTAEGTFRKVGEVTGDINGGDETTLSTPGKVSIK